MPYDVDIGDGADALGQNQLTDALDGTYWVSGWDATLGTGDLEVDIAAGSGAVDGTDVSIASTQTIDFTGDPDSTDPRKAVIYVDSGGTVQKSLGTPQPVDPSGEIRFRTYNPSPPASVSGVVVAEVWIGAGETVLESADVRDRRVSNQAAATSTSNQPNWVEDANSPLVVTGSSSATYTLDGSYDQVLIYADPSLTGFDNLRVNGDSGANYDYVDNSDTQTSGATEFVIQRAGTRSYIKLLSRDGVGVFMDTKGARNQTGMTVGGRNFHVSAEISQFTLLDSVGGNRDTRIRVYGWNAE